MQIFSYLDSHCRWLCCKCTWLQMRNNAAKHVMSWDKLAALVSCCLRRGLRSELS